jgi:CheY-like chemotaxis protein
MKRRTVLVVDDNADTTQALTILLNSLGHDVISSTDGAEAIRLAQTHPAELVVADLILPGAVDGYEIARRLRWMGIYLVAYSGGDHLVQKPIAEDAGFHHYLTKPATIQDFRSLFEQWDRAEAATET